MITRRSAFAPCLALVLSSLLLGGCEKPRPHTEQQGFRGTGMVSVKSPLAIQQASAKVQIPATLPAVAPTGAKASDVFKNVKVLGDVDVGEFTRLMTAMTTWVSPKEGCAYCHDTADMAADSKYTKVVARRMVEMTRHINQAAKSHVAETGVTCYTCHGGQPVPQNIWHQAPVQAASFAGYSAGQNVPAADVGFTSLPNDPFSALLANSKPAESIRVAANSALPRAPSASLKDTEVTYGLMFHLSQALGVNCTFCHNTRSFREWDGVPPRRVTAWHGIQMVRDLNEHFLTPLAGTFPAARLGPAGDGPKLNCATCHQGANKPLGGISMVKDFPELK